jgi:hypothetical protein
MSAERLGKSHALAWAMAMILAVPMLYLLSFGPIYYFQQKYRVALLQNPIIHSLYKPWRWVQDNTPLGDCMGDYMAWWDGKAQP